MVLRQNSKAFFFLHKTKNNACLQLLIKFSSTKIYFQKKRQNVFIKYQKLIYIITYKSLLSDKFTKTADGKKPKFFGKNFNKLCSA